MEVGETCKKLEENDPAFTELRLFEKSSSGDFSKSDWLKLMDSLEKNTTITRLESYNCKFDDDVSSGLAKFLKKTSKLEEFTICPSYIKNISENSVRLILKALTENQTMILRKLTLRSIKMTNQICADLCYALKSLKENLTNLELRGDRIEDSHSFAIAELLRNNKTLQVIDLSYNKISDQGFRILFDALEGNITLQSFYFYGHAMKNFGLKHLFSFLERRSKMIKTPMHIHYSLKGLDPEGFKIYFDFFKNEASEANCLWDYFLNDVSGMDSKSCEYFKDSMISSKIESISLEDCNFGNDGLRLISEGLAGHQSLKELSIEDVPLAEEDGWCTFFESLSSKPLPNLEKLTIKYCTLDGGKVSQKFETFLQTNKNIVELDLEDSCSKAIFQMIARNLNNLKLQTLDLFGADEDFGLETLSKVLETNQTLTDLNLKGGSNVYDDNAFIALSEAIKTNTTLKRLEIDYADLSIDSAAFRNLFGALKDNYSLTDLGDVGFMVDEDDVSAKKMIKMVDGVRARNKYFQESNENTRKRCVGHSLGRFFSDIVIDCQNME